MMVITKKATLQELGDFKASASMLKNAAAAIAILTDSEMAPGTHRQDGCIAATYVLLAAQDHGVGACWVNVNSAGEEAIQQVHRILELEERWNVEALISLGYPGEDRGPKEPRSIAERLKWVTEE